MSYLVFSGFERLASGSLAEACAAARKDPAAVIFERESGRAVDAGLALRSGRPGRPKLGVVAREVTLLPRHWDWLATQPEGASQTLRRLVEQASRGPAAQRRARRDAAYRFATALVANAPGYEEAMRALYAGQKEEFIAQIEAWPLDIRQSLEEMTRDAF